MIENYTGLAESMRFESRPRQKLNFSGSNGCLSDFDDQSYL